MELLELMAELAEHNRSERGYQIHLNSGNLDDGSHKNTGIEFCDLYFTQCRTLRNSTLLCLDTSTSKRIEAIERVDNPDDWFEFPSEKIINIYMLPEDASMNGHRNVVSVGFME